MHVLVTGGGTIAPIDDVRHVANVSSGRFSATIAEAALARGAEVWHVHAPAALLPFARLARYDLDADPAAESERLARLRSDWLAARDRLHLVPLRKGDVHDYAATLEGVLRSVPIDVAFLAMAVSDFEPEARLAGKLETPESSIAIAFRATPKVIRRVREWAPDVYLVGFKLLSGAAEADLIRVAEAATLANRADLTVANDLRTLRECRHAIHLVRPGHPTESFAGDAVADRLVDRAFAWAREAPGRAGLPVAPP